MHSHVCGTYKPCSVRKNYCHYHCQCQLSVTIGTVSAMFHYRRNTTTAIAVTVTITATIASASPVSITKPLSDVLLIFSFLFAFRANRRHRGNHDEPEFSNQSIMNAMEKFVSTVQEMDETILVPCRLMDLKVGDSSDKTAEGEAKSEIHSILNHADLYSLYTMVNAVKNELLWGQNSTPSGEPSNLFVPGVINGKYIIQTHMLSTSD